MLYLADLRAPQLLRECLMYLHEHASFMVMQGKRYQMSDFTSESFISHYHDGSFDDFICYDEAGREVFSYRKRKQITHIDYRFFRPFIDDGHEMLNEYYRF